VEEGEREGGSAIGRVKFSQRRKYVSMFVLGFFPQGGGVGGAGKEAGFKSKGTQ
jgi:hypothetical protein